MIQQKNKNKIHQIITTSILLLSFLNTIITEDITYNAFVLLPVLKNSQYKIITMPEMYVAIIILLSYSIFLLLYEFIIRRKNTEESENGEKTKKNTTHIVSIIVFCVSAIFVLLSLFSLITSKNNAIPEISDGKYLDVHDFGIADKITDTGYRHGNDYFPNKITHRKTLTAEMLLTYEHYYINGTRVSIYQDVLEYKSQKTAERVAELFLSEKYENYTELKADGFDMAYSGHENFIAVIDNTVYRVTIVTTEENLIPSNEKLLEILLSKNK